MLIKPGLPITFFVQVFDSANGAFHIHFCPFGSLLDAHFRFFPERGDPLIVEIKLQGPMWGRAIGNWVVFLSACKMRGWKSVHWMKVKAGNILHGTDE